MGVIAFLECGHYAETGSLTEFKTGGAPVCQCPDCNEIMNINEWWQDAWRSYCSLDGELRAHGNARVYAETHARQHTAHTGHRTSVRWYNLAPPVARAAIALREKSKKLARNDAEGSLPPF